MWKPGLSGPGADRTDEKEGSYVVYNQYIRQSFASQRRALPIFEHRLALLNCIEKFRIVILVGETGCGKSTQLPQYLDEAGWAAGGRLIGITQPRRIAAISVATRVAEEMGALLGGACGYSVQFDHLVSDSTRIKYMTDGHLVREIMADPLLQRYSVIILDEAHERSLQTDVLLGLIKKITKKRPDLRLIISSATMDASSFLKYFTDDRYGEGIILGLEGRQFPVDIQYLEHPSVDYLEQSIKTILDIEFHEGAGDILVFLPGQEEIDIVCRGVKERWESKEKRGSKELVVLPMYAQLTHKAQMRVFIPTPDFCRKVIVATNIAETSITIPGIVYVIDSGFVKVPYYDPVSGLESLLIHPTSQAEALQRAGRAGRVKYGKCFRLYTSELFVTLEKTSVPEMQRSNLEGTVLQLKALGIQDIVHFDFMSPPPAESLIRALELLYALGCVDDECKLTENIGVLLAELPVNPRLGAMLIASLTTGCTEDILTIVSMLSVQNPFMRQGNSKEAKEKLEMNISEFTVADGDHLTLLKIYNDWLEIGCKDAWCQEKSLDSRVLKRAREIRSQLRGYIKRLKGKEDDISTCEGDSVTIRRCVVSGFFANAARLSSNGLYRTVKDGRVVSLHPSSVLYRATRALPNWIVYNDVTLTSQEFIREVSAIHPKWLFELAPHYYETKGNNDFNGPPVKKQKFENKNKGGSKGEAKNVMEGGRLSDILKRYK